MLLLVLAVRPARGQWEQTSGPYGVDVHALTATGDTIFAATGGGVYRLLPQEQSWKLLSLNSSSIGNIWSTPTSLYATYVDTAQNLLAGYRLVTSNDGGRSWSRVSSPFASNVVKFWALASAVDSGRRVIYISASFVNIDGYNFFSSSDNGNSWIPVTPSFGIPSIWIHALTTIGDTIFAATSHGLYVKVPGTPKWSRVVGVPTTLISSSVHFDGKTLFVGTSDGIYSSSDRVTWTQNPSIGGLRSFASLGGVTIAEDSLQYYYTTNEGARWSNISSTFNLLNPLAPVARSTSFVLADRNGVYALSSPAAPLARLDSGIINNDVLSLTFIGTNLFARTKDGFAYTSNQGDTWHTRTTATLPGKTTQITTAAGRIFVGGSGLYRTSDLGITWDTMQGSLAKFSTVTALAASDSTLYAGSSTPSESRLFISSDLGATWLPDPSVQGLVYAIYANGDRVIVFANDAISISNDRGKTWSVEPPPSYAGAVGISIAGTANTIIANTQDIYKTVNGGTDWIDIAINLPTRIDRLFLNDNNVVLGTVNGVYFSRDTGSTWRASNAGLQVETPAVAMDSKYLYAGTFGSSLWRLPRAEANVAATTNNSNFLLYPNPANEVVTIGCSDAASTKNVTIYDELGREVRSFAYRAGAISLAGLHAGVYQCVVQDAKTDVMIGRQKLVIAR